MSETTLPDVAEYCQWPTVADAAAALGVSERAIQKRCKTGTMAAHLIETPQGERWAIAPDELTRTNRRTGREPDELRTRTDEPVGREPREPNANVSTNEASEPANLDANRANLGREPDANHAAHLEREVLFLRGLIEQRDRDAAELRAALREALRAMPKAIEAGSRSTQTASREDEQQERHNVEVAQPTQPTSKATSMAPRRPQRTAWQRIAARILGIR